MMGKSLRKGHGAGGVLPLLLPALLVVFATGARAAPKCVEAEGIAPFSGSEAAAKQEAFARAKWRAMEKVTGANVRTKTVLQNFRLLDQAIVKQARGVVKSATIEQAFRAGGEFHVVARVCVEPANADQAIALLSRDTGVVVFVVAKRPRIKRRWEGAERDLSFTQHLEEMNPVTERLIDELVQRRFAVFDPIASEDVDADALADAFARNDLVRVKRILRTMPASFVVFGEIETNFGRMKGDDIGYGLSMPGYSVDASLRYRLLLRGEDGRMRILGSGVVRDRGIAAAPETAYETALENLAENAVPEIEQKIAREVKGLTRPIRLVVDGVPNTDALFAIKDRLQMIPWVERVEESANGSFTIYYPDKTIYLANAIARIDRLEVTGIDRQRIEARYR